MAINLTNVTFGNAQRGWTSGSISPKAPVSGPMPGPVANIPTSGNIPSNILQAVGNLQGEQAFRNFLSNLIVPQGALSGQPTIQPAPDEAARIQAETERARQRDASAQAQAAANSMNVINWGLGNVPTGFGGISLMGDSSRYNLQNQALGLRRTGWMGGF